MCAAPAGAQEAEPENGIAGVTMMQNIIKMVSWFGGLAAVSLGLAMSAAFLEGAAPSETLLAFGMFGVPVVALGLMSACGGLKLGR